MIEVIRVVIDMDMVPIQISKSRAGSQPFVHTVGKELHHILFVLKLYRIFTSACFLMRLVIGMAELDFDL